MMPTLSDAAVLLSRSLELSLMAKATIILAAGLGVMRLARTARASARHLVMAGCFAGLIALPALVAGVPSLTIDVPLSVSTAPVSAGPAPSAASAARAVERAPAIGARQISWRAALRMIWLAGAVVFLVPIVSVWWRLSAIRRTGLPIAWHRDVLARLVRERGITQPVEVVEHEAVPGPMTFGVLRPMIVLPSDAREWTGAALRRALLHELEHIQRGDWIMQIVARIVAACYWFHPMVWTAWRRLCLEAERSCDDAVVMLEERTDYAEQLVTLAQRMSATPVQPLLGMANRSDLSTRVTAVLDDRLRRGRAGMALAAGTAVVAAAVVMTVAPVRAVARPTADALQESQIMRKVRRAALRVKVRAIDRALYEAAAAGELEEVRELIAAGANVNAVVLGDGSALIGAARSGNLAIARLLLDQGADPNVTVPGDGSALIEAARRGRIDQVALLLDRGADVNLAVDGDENPLMNAAEGGRLEVVKLLVDSGADVHARIWTDRFDGAGEWRTALGQARKNGHAAVVKYLEALGARD